jgi:alcohol dehydrogenase (NADP+)
MSTSSRARFTATTASNARFLTDGAALSPLVETGSAGSTIIECAGEKIVVIPWIGFGTYRLGNKQALSATIQALECGYRAIDTAFIYGGETTEIRVGQAIQEAVTRGIIQSRRDIFVTTKQWRTYHGYDASLECLRLSLERLQLTYIDLWLMHWPGPAWRMNAAQTTTSCTKMTRSTNATTGLLNTVGRGDTSDGGMVVQQIDSDASDTLVWVNAATPAHEMVALRAETYRAMEWAYRQGLVRSIGVSNMSRKQLQTLKRTATLWPPAVNQVELHPLHPQTELLAYCRQEGIQVQAYASLGGQDAGKQFWSNLLGGINKEEAKREQKRGQLQLPLHNLMCVPPVLDLASQLNSTPAQTLLQWGLQRNCIVIPKTLNRDRLIENAGALPLKMSKDQADELQRALLDLVMQSHPGTANVDKLTRLCWRSEPLRQLDFE